MPIGWAIAGGLAAGAVGSMLSGGPDDYSGDIKKQMDNLSGLGDTLKGFGDSTKSTLDEMVKTYSPLFEQQINRSLDTQQQLGGRADSEWASYVNKFRPAAEKFATTALNYDTTERRNQAAADAQANQRTAFDQAGQQLDAELSAAGVDPSSPAAMAQRRMLAGDQAAAVAAAGNTARRQVEDTGLQLLDRTAGLGQTIAGNSLALGDRSAQAGGAATAGVQGLAGFKTAPTTAAAGLYQAAGTQYGDAGRIGAGLQDAATKAWKAKDDSTKDWLSAGLNLATSFL